MIESNTNHLMDRLRTLVVATSVLGAGYGSSGQVTAYEAIDLGLLTPGNDGAVAFAINNRHEIVGWCPDENDVPHAVLWLYCSNYGLDALVLHDLTALASLSGLGQAMDINEAGLVVGGQAASESTPHPFLWDLSTLPALSTIELDNFTSSPKSTGMAWGVNNDSPALVVGESQYDTCLVAGALTRAFKYTEGGAPGSLVNLGVLAGDQQSSAFDVNTATVPKAPGNSIDPCGVNNECDEERNATRWNLNPVSLVALPDSGGDYGSQGWAVNDSANLAGWVRNNDINCQIHAAFWATDTSTPTDLGVVGIPSTQESVAIEMSNVGPSDAVYVVGANSTANHAWRWYRNASGAWSSADLNTLISPACGWSLIVANDVSDDGWIVGTGLIGGTFHAFLLKPIDCVGDLDHDCEIGGADLGILLAAWSCTAPCQQCGADLNLDGVVDGSDLGILLANWQGECDCSCTESSSSSYSGEEASEPTGPAELLLNEGLQALGFASVPEFTTWTNEADSEQVAATLDWLVSYMISGL